MQWEVIEEVGEEAGKSPGSSKMTPTSAGGLT